jgi:putative PIN family toxin of toxin-antitoxin system
MKPRVVLDTNILVSGLLGGTATEVIKQWRAGAFTLIVSEKIMAEYEAVLSRPKFKLPEWVIQELLGYIHEHAEWVIPYREIHEVTRDPSDNKFLEAAVSGQANWLVSGDNDLLGLNEFEGILVIPSWEFLRLL